MRIRQNTTTSVKGSRSSLASGLGCDRKAPAAWAPPRERDAEASMT